MGKWAEAKRKVLSLLDAPRAIPQIIKEANDMSRGTVTGAIYELTRRGLVFLSTEKVKVGKSSMHLYVRADLAEKFNGFVYAPTGQVLKFRSLEEGERLSRFISRDEILAYVDEQTRMNNPPTTCEIFDYFKNRAKEYTSEVNLRSTIYRMLMECWRKGKVIRYGVGGVGGRKIKHHGLIWATAIDNAEKLCEMKLQKIVQSEEYSPVRSIILREIRRASKEGRLLKATELAESKILRPEHRLLISNYIHNIVETIPTIKVHKPKGLMAYDVYVYDSEILQGEALQRAVEEVDKVMSDEALRRLWYGYIFEGIVLAALLELTTNR